MDKDVRKDMLPFTLADHVSVLCSQAGVEASPIQLCPARRCSALASFHPDHMKYPMLEPCLMSLSVAGFVHIFP